jgi:hypothetical protein
LCCNKPDDPGCIATCFFAQNRAVIKLHEQHPSCFAQAFLDCAFQLGKNDVLSEGDDAPVARNGWSDRRSQQLLM